MFPPHCRELKKENKEKKVFILEHLWPNRGKKGRERAWRKISYGGSLD